MLLLIDGGNGGARPDRPPPPRRRRLPAPPWRPFAWFAAFCWLLYAAGTVGGLVGYLLILAAVTLGCWRLDRWLSGLYWGGMSETSVQR
jgi:hypothetical protein